MRGTGAVRCSRKRFAVPKEGEIPHTRIALLSGIAAPRRLDRGLAGEIAPIRLHVSDAAREAAESALRRAGARENAWRCAIAPGASYGAAKCWPPERFALLADRLISECGADVIFFGTPGEKEIAARIRSQDEVARDFAGRARHPCAIWRRCFPPARYLSATIPEPCTWPPPRAFRSSEFLARRIRRALLL